MVYRSCKVSPIKLRANLKYHEWILFSLFVMCTCIVIPGRSSQSQRILRILTARHRLCSRILMRMAKMTLYRSAKVETGLFHSRMVLMGGDPSYLGGPRRMPNASGLQQILMGMGPQMLSFILPSPHSFVIAFTDPLRNAPDSFITVNGSDLNCDASSYRLVSRGALWCVQIQNTAAVINRYDTLSRDKSVFKIGLPSTSTQIIKFWITSVTSASNIHDIVVVDQRFSVYVAAGSPLSNIRFSDFRLATANFSASRGAMCSTNTLMIVPFSSTVFGASQPASAAITCVSSNSGYWYGAPIAADGSSLGAPIQIWVYSHGGKMGSIKAPRPTGWDGSAAPLSPLSGHIPWVYSDFHIADPFGSGTPIALSCNCTRQSSLDFAECLVMPPTRIPYFDRSGYESNAPDLKSTNINLWQAWKLSFRPLLHNGQFGIYDSADLTQARFMFDQLTSVGVSFYISDNTNGLGCDFGNTLAATTALAAFSARYNAEEGRARKLYYTLSVGVNPLGSPSDPSTLGKMDSQLDDVWNMFLNSTDDKVFSIDGNHGNDAANAKALSKAAFRHPVSGKPLLILYVEPSFEVRYTEYLKVNTSSIGNRFHIGFVWFPHLLSDEVLMVHALCFQIF